MGVERFLGVDNAGICQLFLQQREVAKILLILIVLCGAVVDINQNSAILFLLREIASRVFYCGRVLGHHPKPLGRREI